MDARTARIAVRGALILGALFSLGASYRTENFIVTAPTPQLAEAIGQQAERYRRDLAIEWLGHALPRWTHPCPITANVAEHLGAGGATSFIFERGQVFGWQMTIQGSSERILDSVLPHEITHTIFATHFREPLPRWADEGACTTVEHPHEQARHRRMLITFLQSGRGIAMSRLVAMKEYPPDVLPLYAQGYSIVRYLIEQGGRRKFVNFLADGLTDENWPRAIQKFYGDENLGTLQNRWLAWVRQGSPNLKPQHEQPGSSPELLVHRGRRERPNPNLIYHVSSDGRPNAKTAAAALPPAPPAADQQPPLVPVDRPANHLASARPGWRAAGSRQAYPSLAGARPTDEPPPEPTAQPYQAVRQQPPQEPVQTVIEQ